MKTVKFEDQESWLEFRQGKITGTKLKGITEKQKGNGMKIGYYAMIAERLLKPSTQVPDDVFEGESPELEEEKPMTRGSRLEVESLKAFSEATGKVVDTSLLVWVREDDENIAYSPDGVISEEEAVETKSLSSAKHIEAFLTQQIPDEYKHQSIQPFIVNDKLKTLYFCFYDPRLIVRELFWIVVKREDVGADIETLFLREKEVLGMVDFEAKRLLDSPPFGQ